MRDFAEILKEVSYKTSRSGGAGGQHVNKVETKVAVFFNIAQSAFLNDFEKSTLISKLKNRIDNEGILHLAVQDSRSQVKNKELADKRLIELIKNALKEEKKRKPTKISKAANEDRIKVKRIKSETKQNRKKVQW